MERLTDYSTDECTFIIGVGNEKCGDFCEYVEGKCKNCYIEQAFRKLAAYEDAEEQGLLVRLPADKKEIYLISSRWTECSEHGLRFDEYSCGGCEYDCDSKREYYIHTTNLSSISISFYVEQFEKTLFFTREEAEKKLEEMKENEE